MDPAISLRNDLIDFMHKLLDATGIHMHEGNPTDYSVLLFVIAFSLLVWWLLRFGLIFSVRLLSKRFSPDDRIGMILDPENMKKIAVFVSLIILYILIPLAIEPETKSSTIVHRVLDICLTILLLSFVNTVFKVLFNILNHNKNYRARPLKSLLQVIQILLFCIGCIIVVSIVVNKSPANLLTGLGASAAILMLIFRNSILGLVSGVLISEDRMLKPGDWISMPTYDIDGTVREVTLNTVKIDNFDNTTTMIPPYVLTSESFKNWNSMTLSGGRRVMRSINIDISTVKFCSPGLIDRLTRLNLLHDYISAHAQTGQTSPSDIAESVNRSAFTNIGLFRIYLTRYLDTLPSRNKGMMYMVRHLQPTEAGIPVQVYFFTDTTDWVAYETIQAEVFDHIMSVIPCFELAVFQYPTGADFHRVPKPAEDSVSLHRPNDETHNNHD